MAQASQSFTVNSLLAVLLKDNNCSEFFQEVDFGAGPFMLLPVRAEAGEHTTAIWTGNVKIASGLRGLKINPWSFLLPLTPLVWAATLAALLGVIAILQLLPSCLPKYNLHRNGWYANNGFSCIRVILQQGEGAHRPGLDSLLEAGYQCSQKLRLCLRKHSFSVFFFSTEEETAQG